MSGSDGRSDLPRPVVSSWSQEFWEGLEQDRFMLQRCANCSAWQSYPKPMCMVCGSTNLVWEAASGVATVYTWSRMEANPPTPFIADLPYTLVIAELEEGPRFLAWLSGDQEVECGTSLHAIFEDRRDGVRLPAFAVTRA